ncbi:hypothetical protein BH09SUM1_BH09SUM1_30510 [soil metagenome]
MKKEWGIRVFNEGGFLAANQEIGRSQGKQSEKEFPIPHSRFIYILVLSINRTLPTLIASST